MRVSDLMANPGLGAVVDVAGGPGALDRPIAWCAATESIDPSPFLTPGTLIVTSGMAFNVTDARIWDAYVERLATARTAGIVLGLGSAYRVVPRGLSAACERHGMPLLVIPEAVPFVLVQRDIQDRLSAERHTAVRDGLELAEACTRAVLAGRTLHDVLHLVSAALAARVCIQDPTGATLLGSGPKRPEPARTEFAMQSEGKDRFRLVVEAQEEPPLLRILLGPVVAVVSMHLGMTLSSGVLAHSRGADRLTEAVYNNPSIPTDELLRLIQGAALEPNAPIGVVLLQADPTMTTAHLRSASWRTRVLLAGAYPTMRYVEDLELSTILLQGTDLSPARLAEATQKALGSGHGISSAVATAESAAELGLMLRLARRSLGEPGVRAVPAMTYDTVVDALHHPGAVGLSRRLLAPLLDADDASLIKTLAAYLRLNGATAPVCQELYIHRNTLAYRMKRIETLLNMDLRDGQARATLLMALRLSA